MPSWTVASANKQVFEFDHDVTVVVHRSTPGSVWRFAIKGFGSPDYIDTKSHDVRQAKQIALRRLALRLEEVHGQNTAALVDIGTGMGA